MLAVSLSQGKQAIHCLYQGLRATGLKVYRSALRADQRADTRDRDAESLALKLLGNGAGTHLATAFRTG